jgi:hypothetical protein
MIVHRDARHFSPNPFEFMPERWLSEEGAKIAEARGQEYRLNQAAYMPFSYGSSQSQSTLSMFPHWAKANATNTPFSRSD